MAIAIEINEKEYVFDLNRENYRKYVLQDAEYSAIQGRLGKLGNLIRGSKENDDEEVQKKLSNIILENDATLYQQLAMIEQEKIFYASLLTNYPKMTIDESNNLLNSAINEYGFDEVDALCKDLTQNFTRVGNTTKKTMARRIV